MDSLPTAWSEEVFEKVARIEPETLVKWIDAGEIPPASLIFAAEILGKWCTLHIAMPKLLELSHHRSSLVREGAVHGMKYHLGIHASFYGEISRLREMAENDVSSGVRQAAKEALEEFDKI